jgi:plasmid stabilization system protein ParE
VSHKLIFHASIPDDIEDAISYYEQFSPALADRFRAVVNERLNDVADRPESFPVDVPPIRFAKIHRFPYLIYFSTKPEFVSILAILHGATEPGAWRSRE